MKRFLRMLRLDLRNSFGWQTERKLIVIDSDDWGSIRTSSREAYQRMLGKGDRIDADPFTRYDALESEDDLELLFGVLVKYKDIRGRYPVISAYFATANPDFGRIKGSGFETYNFEPFTETLKGYPQHDRVLSLWKEGAGKGIVLPQLHCREHLNVMRWMKDLKDGEPDLRLAFENRMISGGNAFSAQNPYAYMDAFDDRRPETGELIDSVISDACGIFEKTFGFRTASFAPCCYVWTDRLEEALHRNGIGLIQGGWEQFYPKGDKYGDFKKIRHKMGDKNERGQTYLIRNCFFEPSISRTGDAVQNCLAQINSAFHRRKPAVICTHRLNYIGFLDEGNRDGNLRLLDRLLEQILHLWPDVEFVTSVQLGELMNHGRP